MTKCQATNLILKLILGYSHFWTIFLEIGQDEEGCFNFAVAIFTLSDSSFGVLKSQKSHVMHSLSSYDAFIHNVFYCNSHNSASVLKNKDDHIVKDILACSKKCIAS